MIPEFTLSTEQKPDGIVVHWPNGDLAGIIRAVVVGGAVMWKVEVVESGMPHLIFNDNKAAEYYMLAACREYIDTTDQLHLIERKRDDVSAA